MARIVYNRLRTADEVEPLIELSKYWYYVINNGYAARHSSKEKTMRILRKNTNYKYRCIMTDGVLMIWPKKQEKKKTKILNMRLF